MRRAAEEGFSTATDFADYLVKKGLPFRDAHEAVARAVRLATERGCFLAALPLTELQRLAPAVEADVFDHLSVDGSVAARDHAGGTSPRQVQAQVGRWKRRLADR
jgi:argininosuccinate lyase